MSTEIPKDLETWIEETWPQLACDWNESVNGKNLQREAARAAIQKLMPLVEAARYGATERNPNVYTLIDKCVTALTECGLSDD